MELKHITFRAPIDLIEKLEEEARSDKRSRNYVIVEILERHFTNGTQKPATKKKAGK